MLWVHTYHLPGNSHKCNIYAFYACSRISSVGRVFDCRAGGRGFDSRGRTITQGLKMTEKWRYFLCTASGETFAWLGWPRKMAVPPPVGDVKIVSPISTFVLNTLTLNDFFFIIRFKQQNMIAELHSDRIDLHSHLTHTQLCCTSLTDWRIIEKWEVRNRKQGVCLISKTHQ